MNFIECKDLKIVNCDYAKLKKQKQEIEDENARIQSKNRSVRATEVILIVVWSLLMVALTSFAMIMLWQSIQFNIEGGPFFKQFKAIDPMWIKCVMEIVVLLLGISLFRVVLTAITVSSDKKIQTIKALSEQIYFASIIENATIGNFQYAKLFNNEPYAGQRIAFSFDAFSNSGNDCHSYVNDSNKWRASLIPGIFQTVIDVENLTVLIPHYNEGETAKSLEDAYLVEKVKNAELEESLALALANKSDSEKEALEQLAFAEKQNEILEKDILRKNEAIAEKDRYIKALLDDATQKEEQFRTVVLAKEESDKAIEQLREDKDAEIRLIKTENDKKIEEIQKESETKLFNMETERQKQLMSMQEDHIAEVNKLQFEAKTDCERLTNQINEQNLAISTLAKENKDLLERNAQLEHNAKSDQIYHRNMETEHEKLKGSYRELEDQLATLQEEKKAWVASEQLLEGQNQEIARLEERCGLLERQKEALSNQFANYEQVVANLNEKQQKLESTNASLEQGNKDLRDRNKKLAEEKITLERTIEAKEKDCEKLKEQCAEITENKDRVTSDLLELQNKYNTSQNYVASLQSQLDKAYKDAESIAERVRKEVEEEMTTKREAEGLDFSQKMRLREEQLRKKREDMQAAQAEKKD